jgi:hypothetical protein
LRFDPRFPVDVAAFTVTVSEELALTFPWPAAPGPGNFSSVKIALVIN